MKRFCKKAWENSKKEEKKEKKQMEKTNLERGFLVLYDWVPVFQYLPGKEGKKLLLALIERQRDGTPMPLFSNSETSIFAMMIEPCIERRLAGSKGGKAQAERRREEEAAGEGSLRSILQARREAKQS